MGRLAPFLDDLVIAAFAVVAVGFLARAWLGTFLLALAIYFVFKVWLLRAHLRAPVIGTEAMIGRVAEVLTELHLSGQVRLDGEIWTAEAMEPVAAGERVRVVAVEGLVLRVAPLGVVGPVWEPRRESLLLDLARRMRRP